MDSKPIGSGLWAGEGRANPAIEHCSPRAIGWKRSADVICFQWLFQKNNCGDTDWSIIWIFVFECSVCVALREHRKYKAVDPNTIKMDCVCVCGHRGCVCVCVFVCRGICRSGNHHLAPDIIGRITKCVLWACNRLIFPPSLFVLVSSFYLREKQRLGLNTLT